MGDYVLILKTKDQNLLEFVSRRIRDGGLHISPCSHPKNKTYSAFIVSTPEELISKEAEGWGFLKRDLKGFKREYRRANHSLYQPPFTNKPPVKSLFTPSELSYITNEVMKRIKMKSLPDFFPRPKSGLLKSDPVILALERVEMIQFWPLHSSSEECAESWKVGPLNKSFSDHVEHYFGSNVALYFAWLTNYITWLILPAVAGSLVSLYHYIHPDINVDNSLVTPIYTLFIVIWGVLFVKGWERKRSSLVCDWGIEEVQWRREVRPGFTGRKRISPVTGMPERHFSSQERLFRYCVSAFVTLALLIVAFFFMVLSLNLQGYIHKFSYSRNYLLFPSISWLCDEGQIFDRSGKGPMPYLFLKVPIILHLVAIQILNKIFQVVANILTNWENHRSPIQHENALYIKRFFFEAFDCYIALFYLAFVEADIVLLRKTLTSFYTYDSLRRLSCETFIPLLTRKASRKIAKKEDKASSNSRMDEDYDKGEYEQFDDYLEMIVQLGYVTLFAGAFPLAAPLSVICNILELYSDIFKLTFITRRPKVHRVTNIGVWSFLVKGIVLLSIFTNLYIFCFTSEQLMTYAPNFFDRVPLSPEEALKAGSDHYHVIAADAGMAVATTMMSLEHMILFLVVVMWLMVPETTPSVKDETARREYVKFMESIGSTGENGVAAMCTSVGTKPKNLWGKVKLFHENSEINEH